MLLIVSNRDGGLRVNLVVALVIPHANRVRLLLAVVVDGSYLLARVEKLGLVVESGVSFFQMLRR
jgi:hypothetical protein